MTAIETFSPETLHEAVGQMHAQGFRLVQLHCRRCEVGVTHGHELTYTFDKDLSMRHLRVLIPAGFAQDSIGDYYSYAFLYENEIHDLFGVEFHNLSVDYHGTFYRTAVPTPMNEDGGGKHGR